MGQSGFGLIEHASSDWYNYRIWCVFRLKM